MSTPAEVARRVMESWRNAENAVELGLIAEDVEYVNPDDAVDTGTRRGHEGWLAAIANFGGVFELTGMDVTRFEEIGEKVLVLVTFHIRARGSGAEAQRDLGYVFTVRDGQVTRFEWHNGHEPAIQAATGTG